MIYDLSNALHLESFKLRCNALVKKRVIVELTERKPRRTSQQNRYLYVIIGLLASELGETTEYVKEQYFKRLCNPEIFIRTKEDQFRGNIEVVRSTGDLDTAEMSTAIDRFRNWAATEGYYLPSPEDDAMLAMAEREIIRNNTYL